MYCRHVPGIKKKKKMKDLCQRRGQVECSDIVMTPPVVESLPESKLGTKEHWDGVYEYVLALT